MPAYKLLCILAALVVLYFVQSSLFPLGSNPELATSEGAPGGERAADEEDDPTAIHRSAAVLKALPLLRAGELDGALLELTQGCSEDDGGCWNLLGEMHLTGSAVSRNLSRAIELFERGVDAGDADSMYALGVMHSNLLEAVHDGPAGSDSPDSKVYRRNESLAVLYFYAASLAGHPGALMAMGYRHSMGFGVPRSCNSAALNYVEVARRVVKAYSQGMPQAVELIRLGVESQERKAMTATEVSVFVELAASGDAAVAAAVGKRYLLGIEGFRQDYQKAYHHLKTAERQGHASAKALIGYMYCLGLGFSRDYDVAYRYFSAAAQSLDPLGHNGMGFLHFHGLSKAEKDLRLAFHYFNKSAYLASADGMFNLALMYLAGSGVERSFQTAIFWLTQAIDRGHTSSAYALAVMYLNRIGTARNCRTAVELFKRVCERGGWVTNKLQVAYEQAETYPDRAAWYFLRLAEAGHEVAQMNAAHLLDAGDSVLLQRQDAQNARASSRIFAQRHYQLSAEQGSVLADVRLGDYAYYGWGLRYDDGLPPPGTEAAADEDRLDMMAEELLTRGPAAEARLVTQDANMELALAHYRRGAASRSTSEWMRPIVAKACFNLGLMHQFGMGIPQSPKAAQMYYSRSIESDPHGVQTPVALMRLLLLCSDALDLSPHFAQALLRDVRLHLSVLQLVLLALLVAFLWRISTPAAPAPAAAAASTAETGAGARDGGGGGAQPERPAT